MNKGATNLSMDSALREEIRNVFEGFRKENCIQKGTIDRWDKFPEGDKVIESLARQEHKWCKDRPINWQLSLRATLSLLLWNLGDWLYEIKTGPPRPREREEAIMRIVFHALKISEDINLLGLPSRSSMYFTQEELFERFEQLFNMFDLPEALSRPDIVDFRRDLKPYLELAFARFPKSDVLLSDLVLKLADRKLLDQLAQPSIATKTESENFPRVYLMRKLAEWFTRRYGAELQNTIADLCVIVFDDESIDRDAVRSALAGYNVEAQPDWHSQILPYERVIQKLNLPEQKKTKQS